MFSYIFLFPIFVGRVLPVIFTALYFFYLFSVCSPLIVFSAVTSLTFCTKCSFSWLTFVQQITVYLYYSRQFIFLTFFFPSSYSGYSCCYGYILFDLVCLAFILANIRVVNDAVIFITLSFNNIPFPFRFFSCVNLGYSCCVL